MTDIEKANEGEKTFTQEEVNAIVSKRLAEDRAKAGTDLAKREQEITQRELRLTATEKINEKGLPIDVLDMLDLSSEETMMKGLDLTEKVLAEKANVPTVAKVSTGGEHNTNGSSSADPIRDAMGLTKG